MSADERNVEARLVKTGRVEEKKKEKKTAEECDFVYTTSTH